MTLANTYQIQTVLGRIPADELGVTDVHTHLIRDGGSLVDADPDFYLASAETAVDELRLFRHAGGGAVVDMMPAAPGRNAHRLAEISAAAGVHVIAATGFTSWSLYPGAVAWNCSEEELAAMSAAEVTDGIDAGNYSEATVRRSPVRAGVIKVSLENDVPSNGELKFIGAAARAHCLTGAPVSVHTHRGLGALGLVELLGHRGVDASALLLAHAFQPGNSALLRSLAAAGAFLIVDGAGKPHCDEAALIAEVGKLVQAGFADRLLLASDFSRRRYWRSCGGNPGFAYLIDSFALRLTSHGIPESVVRRMLVANPARALSLRQTAGCTHANLSLSER
jgi:phosphotriesterase-related protein